MLRKDRQITNLCEIENIIKECMVVRVAFIDGDEPYIVPFNFGYTFIEQKLTFYLHCANKGHKLDIINNKNTKVCAEMDTRHALNKRGTSQDIPCQYGYNYASVIAHGDIQIVTQNTEKEFALNEIMKHQTGKSFAFKQNMLDSVTVLKIECYKYTAKQNK